VGGGDGRCRLLTLVGPGGVGKTRLVRRVLEELRPGYADGGAFVPLDDVATSDEFRARLARELDVRVCGRDAIDEIVAALRDRQMLVVLDNFEQAASGAGQLQRLIDGCPGLTLVVTSRVRLALPGEWVFPVEGLPCPEDEDQDRIEAFDAARLFVQSARRVQPALDVAAESPAIVDICRQVEGLPLALELAAGWTRVMSCEAIASELRHGTELLKAVDDARSARHASFDVVFDQSWQLLRPAERDALARLSVFRGGFSPEAARAVCGASLPVLGALVDKSLLRKDGARITMHPLVQQLAAERLDGDAIRLATASAHARHFHQLVARSSLDIRNGDRRALDAIDQDFANFRAAWQNAAEQGAADLLRTSLRATLDFCDHRGRLAEGLTLFRDALGSRATMRDPGLDPRLRSVIAHLESRLDRHADAQATVRAALATPAGREDFDTRLQCLTVLGTCALRLGDYDAARRHYREALEIAPPEHHPHNGAALLVNLAVIEKSLGDFDAALALFVRALHQYRQLGDLGGQALCHNNLGDLYLELDEPAVAAPYLREGLALCEQHRFAYTRMLILANLADVALRGQDDAAAERHARLALEAAMETGNRAVACVAGITLARVALRRGDAAAAHAELGAAAGQANATGEPTLQLAVVLCWADVVAAAGDVPSAHRVLAAVSGHPLASEGQRREARRRLGVHDVPKDGAPQGLDLAALVQRIESESGIAHAPLIAALRGAR
jgi:predicted ATPase/Tfp pilus assembly protein PilF